MDLHQIIESQYQATLAMLQEAIEKCPDAMWNGLERNRFWHIAFHALFYTHLYLQDAEENFVPWPKTRDRYPSFSLPRTEEPYYKEDMLEYAEFCKREVKERVASLDLDGASGFHWLPFSKTELQLYNIRHTQHHAGQLSDRLTTGPGISVRWVWAKREQGEA